MGSTESRVKNDIKPKFSDIKSRLEHIFANNNRETFNETSMCETLCNFNDTDTYKPKPCCDGNYINKKYHKYDPTTYKKYLMNGGKITSVTESSIENLSENSALVKMKDILVKNDNYDNHENKRLFINKQMGGACGDDPSACKTPFFDATLLTSSPVTEINENFDITELIRGGADDDDSSDIEIDSDAMEDVIEEISNNVAENDMADVVENDMADVVENNAVEDNDVVDDSSSNDSPGNYIGEISDSDGNDVENESDADESDESDKHDEDIDNMVNESEESSYNKTSNELMPFYTTEDGTDFEFRHMN